MFPFRRGNVPEKPSSTPCQSHEARNVSASHNKKTLVSSNSCTMIVGCSMAIPEKLDSVDERFSGVLPVHQRQPLGGARESCQQCLVRKQQRLHASNTRYNTNQNTITKIYEGDRRYARVVAEGGEVYVTQRAAFRKHSCRHLRSPPPILLTDNCCLPRAPTV